MDISKIAKYVAVASTSVAVVCVAVVKTSQIVRGIKSDSLKKQ